MIEHHVYALEGADGSGKTSTGKIVAAENGGRYFYCMEGNPLAPYRKKFDTAPLPVRFLYYVAVPLLNYSKLEKMREESDVFLDRSVASTYAYHKAYGLPDYWLNLIPSKLWDQISKMIYFTVSEEERIRRLTGRALSEDVMTESDKKSLLFRQQIDQAYRSILQDRTIVADTTNQRPELVAKSVLEQLSKTR